MRRSPAGVAVESFADRGGGPKGCERAGAAAAHAGIRRYVKHRSPRAAHGAGTQTAVEEKSEVEGASAASINDGAGDAREADGRESDHGEEFASQRRVHQVTIGP